MKNQVFISYRRKDGIYPALLLFQDLIEAGYSVFFDIKSLRCGQFPSIIKENIEYCTDFILLVTKETFCDRIHDADDWIRQEIKMALNLNKNIIPVFIETEYPKQLPEDISIILNYNGIREADVNIIKETHKKLFDNFLKSMPNIQLDNLIVTRRCSIYEADYGDEATRLKIQSENAYQADMMALASLRMPEPIFVLDVGCAYGYVGKSRFEGNKYKKILGIDVNNKCLDFAKANNTAVKYQQHYDTRNI